MNRLTPARFVNTFTNMESAKVVIIGAGFGGLHAAKALASSAATGAVDVTVVDRNNFHTFQPLLYQVATSGLNAADVAHPVRPVFRDLPHVRFRLGTVTGLDHAARTVHLDDGEDLAFDHLIVAAGSGTNFFGVAGAADHAFPLYTLDHAIELRERVLTAFEEADRVPDRAVEGVLTFVIVGGGPTGVETAGALAELFDRVLRKDFPAVPVERARVVLVEMGDVLLGPFTRRSQRHALAALRARGVDVRLSTRVAAVAPDHVVLDGGEVLPTKTLVWAAGVRANPLVEALGLPTGPGGRIVVDADLAVTGHPGIWAIGDVAHMADDAGSVPQLAPAAMQSGATVGRNVAASVAGRPTEAFAYRNKGTMATIGRRAAVTEIPKLPTLTGSVAWVAWLVLHLWMLMGMRNRLSVFLNWVWSYVTWDRGPRLILDRRAAVSPGRGSDRP